jgi:hypothetical protein
VQSDPLVQAVLARFPGAEIVGIHSRIDAMAGENDDGLSFAPAPDDDNDNDDGP